MLRHYNVFDLGQNSIYEDDERNCSRIRHLASTAYLPAIDMLLKQVGQHHGDFRFALHASIPALELFEQYTPEVIDGLRALSDTKCVEFVAGAAHSLAFLYSRDEFCRQLASYTELSKTLFGQKPTCFCSTELIYNNDFASCLESMGFKVMLAEGADHVLGWRSPNFVYRPEHAPKIHLLLRSRKLSRDLYLRFSDKSWDKWPLTAETYASWCAEAGKRSDVINLFMNLNIFGVINKPESGIFDFMRCLPAQMLEKGLSFATPGEVVQKYEVRDTIDVNNFISWDDAGGDLNSWLGNDMQKDAVHFLYSLTGRVHALNDPQLLHDFTRLQTSNYLRWMSTKWFSTSILREDSPFKSPQDAYTTYMNILADFEMRLEVAEEDVSKWAKKAQSEDDEKNAEKLRKKKTRTSQCKQLVA